MTGRPRLRAFLWVSAVLLGGLGLVVLAYALIAGANLFYAFAAFIIALLAVAYMILVLLSFERSKQNSRWYDRERRGF
jgi:peptidoglycan/LPS O-acetylase OafA/YrhL